MSHLFLTWGIRILANKEKMFLHSSPQIIPVAVYSEAPYSYTIT